VTSNRKTKLRRPLEEAAEKLKSQFTRGQLLEIQASVQPEQFRLSAKAWLDYNIELLRDLFTNDEVLQEYLRSDHARTDFDIFADQYEREIDDLRDDIREKLPRLHSIMQRLEFFSNDTTSPQIDLDVTMQIPNNKQMKDDLPLHYASAKTKHQPLALLMIDVDDLKTLNETVGHPDANRVLHAIAQSVRQNLAGRGEVYRYAGDELMVVLQNFELEEAAAVAERLRKHVELLSHAPLNVKATITVGVAAFPEPVGNPDDLEKAADSALMKAKAAGKNCVFRCDQ